MKWWVVGSIGVLLVSGAWFAVPALSTSAYQLQNFAHDLDAASRDDKQAVAERYLSEFSVSQLNGALEEAYPLAACHEQAHPVGRAVYAQTKNLTDAIASCGNGCNLGCFHGALMGMFSTDSDTLGGIIEDERPEEYMAHVKALAAKLCTQPEVADVVQRNFCVHGLGHVFEYTNGYNLDAGLESCRIFDSPFTASCVQGVYMEYVNNPQLRDELLATDVSFCDRFHKSATLCYAYMARFWLAHDGKIIPVLKQCQALEGERPAQCIWGVIFSISSMQLLSTDSGIDKYCGFLSGKQYDACIDGAVEKIVDNDSSGTLASCKAIAPRFRDQCTQRLTYWQDVSAHPSVQ